MARLGEGDPRWLVQDRADGRNVNSWHWEEKDIGGWAKPMLKSYVEQVVVVDDAATSFKTTVADKLDGDFSVSVRKGRLIFVYDVEMTIKWEGTFKDTGKIIKGTFETNFDTEDYEDIEITARADGYGDNEDKMKNVGRTKGVPLLKSKLAEFLREMKQKVTSQASAPATPPTSTPASPQPAAKPAAAAPAPAPKPKPAPPPAPSAKTLTMNVSFNAPAEAVYSTLLDAGRVSAFTQSAAEIKGEVGAPFTLFNGNVTGEITSLEPPRKIVQKWRSRSWAEGVFSTVTYDFTPSKDGCKVVLTQEGIPPDDFERTESGWRSLVWEPIRMLFGYVRLGDEMN